MELAEGQSGRQPHHPANGNPKHHRLSIPDHKPLRIGTLNAILRQVAAAKGVAREDILK